ncbi:MAG TPA: hypothetical protein VJM31_06635 [Vicinamibacterales bacterium]|nr:hypothetical protein [Vicinamibacterales bacterium]
MKSTLCVLIAVAVAAVSPCQAQSAAPASLTLPLVYSTTPMTRNADLMLSASILSTSISEAGLAKLSPSLFRSTRRSARVARAAKLALLDVPIVNYFQTLNHEWGHMTRATEYGVDSALSFVGTPWSSQQFAVGPVGERPPEHHPLEDAAIQGGGLDASLVLKDRAESKMLRAERVPPGHALAAIISSIDVPMYSLLHLSAEDFYPGLFGDYYPGGDAANLVLDLFNRRRAVGPANLDSIRRQVRTRSVLNLLDAALWSEAVGVLSDHVWSGAPDVRIRWLHVGGVRVLPSVRYELSPFGPEYHVRSHYRALGAIGSVYGRWTERIGADRQVGGGFSWSRWSTPGFVPKVSPTLTMDAWSHTVHGFGMRGEVGADVRGWPAERAALTVTVGAKSFGHLPGFPMDRGAYINGGLTLKVW